jgi:fatty acid desaturase
MHAPTPRYVNGPVPLPMTPSSQFPLDNARELVKGLNIPNPWIYWTDFLFSMTLGWTMFILALRSPPFSAWQVCFYLVTTLALYRAVIFTHELAHLRRTTFRWFRLVWNVTCGFPLMVPSFMYGGVHNDHHKRKVYGTREDGEYLPFAVKPPCKIVLYLLQVFVLPLLLAGRFILLTPLSYLHGRLRRLVWKSASSLTIDFDYRRPEPSFRDEESWRWQEFATFLYGATAVTLVITGLWPWQVLLQWYLVSLLIFLLNSLRTLAAHSYRNPGDRIMEFAEQYLDSVNIPGNSLFTTLWAPVGLRYHATHHLFPALPYHALGEAHRRLVRELPDNTLYLQTLRNSLWDALRRLWGESRAHKRSEHTASA